ncbi:MAG: RsmE family RNA methyltransferase [Candidatus Omnitrophica bacterium]|nr:RsmE family RNA methyltransferase [Candidatus Omnitrophota bacterium]
MNRFYVPKENIGGGMIRVTDRDDVRHLTKVLRVRPGEHVFISDGEGRAYVAVLEGADARCASMKIKETLAEKVREQSLWRLALAVAVPKSTRFEEVVDKATQLGVDEIIPLITERTLVTGARVHHKMERYRRVMDAAAKQSGALFLPCLQEPVEFDVLLKERAGSYDLRLLPNLSSNSVALKDIFSRFSGGRILACIGPEGDFSPAEVDAALRAGFQGVSLGDSVLRVDTAAISVAAFIRIQLGRS